MSTSNNPNFAARRIGAAGKKQEPRNPWPHKIKAKFIRVGGLRGTGGRIMRLMTCPICGKWWERPVSGNYGCSAACQDAVYRKKWMFGSNLQ